MSVRTVSGEKAEAGLAAPIRQSTKRANLRSTAHLSTREFPSGRVSQVLARSDTAHRLTRLAVVPTVSRPAFR